MQRIKVVVNGRSLMRRLTGVERYTTEILGCLGDQVHIIQPAGNHQGWIGHAWEQFVLPGQMDSGSVLWSPANTGPLVVSNQVLTVHDLSPLEHPEWYQPAFAAWYRLFLPILIRRVKRIITPSQYVQRRVISWLHLSSNQVVVIPAGVNVNRFYHQQPPVQFGRYILFVGSIAPRKNLAALIAAWKQIEKRHPGVDLVIAGVSGSVFREVHLPEAVERLHCIGYVPDAQLPSLYSGADLFVLPSWEEGFGLPVLEAMACGTPIVASNAGALPEVAGEAGLFFHPNDPDELAEQIHRGLIDAGLRQSLSERGLERARQFSWQSTAEMVWQTLRGAGDEI